MPRRGRFGLHLVTNPDGMEATLGEPPILVTDRKISSLTDLPPIFEKPPQQVTCRTAATSLGSAACRSRQATSVGSATISTPRSRASSYSSGMIGS
jgi:hypothetical protein